MSRSHAHSARRPHRAFALAPVAASTPGGLRSRLLAGLVAAGLSAACTSSAQAQTLASHDRPIQSVHESPYSIDLLAPDGQPLPTYQHRGRYYVLGDAGDRYTVRVTNPTSRRVEAVISIDGLDAIDGETADYASKRGYVVPAYGEVRVDGFRVSEQAVAAFRFSSVAGSYAGRKGQPRNVGVVGVAIFEEAGGHPQVLADRDRRYGHRAPPRSRQSRRGSVGGAGQAPRADAPLDEAEDSASAGSAAPRSRSRAEAAPTPRGGYDGHASRRPSPSPHHRPGLGTGFGERRHAPVTWTRFVRADADRPTAIAELRYNDAPGLAALGIDVAPYYTHDEVWMRETASPFPFARPPGY